MTYHLLLPLTGKNTSTRTIVIRVGLGNVTDPFERAVGINLEVLVRSGIERTPLASIIARRKTSLGRGVGRESNNGSSNGREAIGRIVIIGNIAVGSIPGKGFPVSKIRCLYREKVNQQKCC